MNLFSYLGTMFNTVVVTNPRSIKGLYGWTIDSHVKHGWRIRDAIMRCSIAHSKDRRVLEEWAKKNL